MKAALPFLLFLLTVPNLASAEPECGTIMTTQQGQVASGEVVWVGEAPENVRDEDVEDAIEYGIAQWNGVACSNASLTYGGRLESIEEVDDQIPLLFARPEEVPCFPEGFLGFTVFTCSSIPTPTVYLNDGDFDWTRDATPFQGAERLEVDLRSAITHELGHVLGIPHLDHPLATMVANYLIDGGQASLAAEDKLALCEITGGGRDECSTSSDCDDFGQCIEGENFRVCNEERGSFGDYCSLAFQICDEICLVSDPNAGVGYCSTTCSADDDCPTDYVCTGTEDTRRCELAQVFDDGGSCTTARGSSGWLPFALVLLALISSRARSKSRRSLCRAGHASKR